MRNMTGQMTNVLVPRPISFRVYLVIFHMVKFESFSILYSGDFIVFYLDLCCTSFVRYVKGSVTTLYHEVVLKRYS